MAECVLTEDQPFRMLKQLGEGGYGTVHLVDHKCLGLVAYKTCPVAPTDKTELELEAEAEAERHRTLRHPNVVILYDTVFNSTCCGLFIEYMKYGSVDKFIKRFKVPPELKIQILYETSRGMSYLHSNRPIIIHGDLSSQNILIGEGFHAKIADFGLSRTLKENYENSTTDTQLRGKPIYIAPEYFKDPRRRKSEKFDVYGFAISAWEILSQKRAYHDFGIKELVPTFVKRGERPDIKELDVSIPRTVKKLIKKCWHENDKKRSGFEIVRDELFIYVSKIQSELRRAYVSLASQEEIMHLSNGMETCGISNTGTITMGEQTPEVNRSTDTTVLVKLPTSGNVRGITSWNDELYVVTSGSPDNIDTLAHRRKIRVEGLVCAWDIVAHANVLYVGEREDKLIHRIQLSDETSSHWYVNGKRMAMSINKKGNVVVVSGMIFDNKISEYTPIGSCVREIQVIDKIILGLRHAIQMDDDRFLICHSATTHHRVCIIDSKSRIMKSYGGGPGSEIGQMNYPCYLAIDRKGFILVADLYNNRIIQSNASLEFVKEFIPGSVGLKSPWRMHYTRGQEKYVYCRK